MNFLILQVETKQLNLAVKRNLKRFPSDFMFRLNKKEWTSLRFQFETSKTRGGTRYLPYVFTEQGVSMLSAILNSQRAINVSLAIIRTFVMIRRYASDFKELNIQIKKIERKMNRKFSNVYEALHYLLEQDKNNLLQKERKRIGFKPSNSLAFATQLIS